VSPEDSVAWTRLGSAFLASGDKTRARAAYEKAMAYDPTNQKLKEFMDQYLKQ
jgi:cytochrome c-type biogenesis protein CcmH/NrfG